MRISLIGYGSMDKMITEKPAASDEGKKHSFFVTVSNNEDDVASFLKEHIM